MKTRYSLLFLFLFSSCDLTLDSIGEWDDVYVYYSASVKVIDVNSEICYRAMLGLKGDTKTYSAGPDSGKIKVDFLVNNAENLPTWVNKTAYVYIHQDYYYYMELYDSTKYKIVDIPFKKGSRYPLYTVQFDIPM
jgi:hypothetical protein